jgi:two-component system sensor histidine kinase CpxA
VRSLLVRIFLSFWLMIVITIAAAAGVGFYYAERARSAIERFEVSDAMLEASEALRVEGREGLEGWLKSLKGVTKSLIYVVDGRGRDILGRRIPAPVVIALRRFGDERRGGRDRERGNLRPARPFTQLIGTDGSVYTIFVLPPQGNVARWLEDRSPLTLGFLAFIASALVSLLLARTISRPVERLRDSAGAIAQGKLDTRVPATVSERKDEIGRLGKEFDRMAVELQRALERQTELTANVSHELRSPLARLRVALELARRKAGDLSEFERMDEETERLDALIGQILEFSRLDARSSEERTRFNLADLLHAVVEDVRFEFGNDISVSLGVPDDAVVIDAYEGALRACISNVLRNAAIHGSQGGNIRIDLTSEAGDALIAIQDDAGGVENDDLENLFEPFFRGSRPGDETADQGTGLGLAIAARAARKNGGSIQAVNKNGGLLVTIRLPA